MGYAAVDILIYGIAVDEDVAAAIYEKEFDLNTGSFKEELEAKRIMARPVRPGDKPSDPNLPTSPYGHDFGLRSVVFNIDLVSEGTDSRIHDNNFEPGHQHYIGIFVASNGYAYNDPLVPFIRKVPNEVIDNFNESVVPLLLRYGVTEISPDIHIVNQTW